MEEPPQRTHKKQTTPPPASCLATYTSNCSLLPTRPVPRHAQPYYVPRLRPVDSKACAAPHFHPLRNALGARQSRATPLFAPPRAKLSRTFWQDFDVPGSDEDIN